MSVIVIGGGIAGLVTAFRLKQLGKKVTVIESSSRVGGKISSELLDGECFDIGPNTVLESNDAIKQLIKDLNLNDCMIFPSTDAKARFIQKNRRLYSLPISLIEFIRTPLISFNAKLRLLKEPLIAPLKKEETIAEFISRRFGKEILDYLINPFLIGIYAAKPEELSSFFALKGLKDLETKHGSVIVGALKKQFSTRNLKKSYSGNMFSFEGGFSTVIEKLSEVLKEEIITESTVKLVSKDGSGWKVEYEYCNDTKYLHASQVVFATPSYETAKLISHLNRELSLRLISIPYSPIAQVFLGFRKGDVQVPKGFGFLVPENETSTILGTVFNSSIFPTRYNRETFTIFIGGTRNPEMVDFTDAQLIQIAITELQSLLNFSALPEVKSLKKWKHAIPQYQVGHSERLKLTDEVEGVSVLSFVGNWRGGVSLPDTVAQAYTVANGLGVK